MWRLKSPINTRSWGVRLCRTVNPATQWRQKRQDRVVDIFWEYWGKPIHHAEQSRGQDTKLFDAICHREGLRLIAIIQNFHHHAIVELTHNCRKLAGPTKLLHDFLQAFPADSVKGLGQIDECNKEVAVLLLDFFWRCCAAGSCPQLLVPCESHTDFPGAGSLAARGPESSQQWTRMRYFVYNSQLDQSIYHLTQTLVRFLWNVADWRW